jgi:hypothetical protein
MSFTEKRWFLQWLMPFFVAFCFGMLMRIAFVNNRIEFWLNLLTVMSLTFLILVPYGIGYLTIWFLPRNKQVSGWESVLFPWITTAAFLTITICFTIEGWPCWIMALPFFLLFSSIGGYMAKVHRKKWRNGRLNVCLVVLLPLIVGPIEHLIHFIPGTYTANTSIIIHAPADSIWNNVTRVRYIPVNQTNTTLTSVMGFPRPIKAELNYEGVGATREAIFDKGLTFHG